MASSSNSNSKKQNLRAVQLQKAIQKQKELDKYLLEVQEYFEFIADEDEDENLEREDFWATREMNGVPLRDITHDAFGNEIQFKGNADIKPPKISLPFDQDHIDEFTYCAYHPIYTITNYFKIISEDRGLIPFDLYDFQKILTRNVFKNTRNLAMFARQSGKCFSSDTGLITSKKPTRGFKLLLYKIIKYFIPAFFNKIENVGTINNIGKTNRQ